MSDLKKRIDDTLKELKQERDELQVKVHLARLEAGDEWQKLESKFTRFEGKAREIGVATADASEDILEAAKLLGEEIRDGFKKIARHF